MRAWTNWGPPINLQEEGGTPLAAVLGSGSLRHILKQSLGRVPGSCNGVLKRLLESLLEREAGHGRLRQRLISFIYLQPSGNTQWSLLLMAGRVRVSVRAAGLFP